MSTAAKIKAIRERMGLSMSDIAKALGMKAVASSWQRYELESTYARRNYLRLDLAQKFYEKFSDRKDGPTAEEMAEIAGVSSKKGFFGVAPQGRTTVKAPAAEDSQFFSARSGPSNPLPVRGFLKAGEQGYFYENGDVRDWIERPIDLRGAPDAYAMQLRDYSMVPFQPGWWITFDPQKPCRSGDLVAVYLKNGEALFKEIVKIGEREVVLRQYGPPKEFVLKRSEIQALHRFSTVHAERP